MQNKQVLSAYCHPPAWSKHLELCIDSPQCAYKLCFSPSYQIWQVCGETFPTASHPKPLPTAKTMPALGCSTSCGPQPADLWGGTGVCALYPGMLPALSINLAPLPDGELMLQMCSVPCHYLTSPKGYSPRVMLLKGTACFACRGQVRLLLCACCKMLLFRKGLMLRGLAPWRCWQKAGGKEALF